jgi:hypothetical protein
MMYADGQIVWYPKLRQPVLVREMTGTIRQFVHVRTRSGVNYLLGVGEVQEIVDRDGGRYWRTGGPDQESIDAVLDVTVIYLKEGDLKIKVPNVL